LRPRENSGEPSLRPDKSGLRGQPDCAERVCNLLNIDAKCSWTSLKRGALTLFKDICKLAYKPPASARLLYKMLAEYIFPTKETLKILFPLKFRSLVYVIVNAEEFTAEELTHL